MSKCRYCNTQLEEGECNLRNDDETDIYWYCPECDYDEREEE